MFIKLTNAAQGVAFVTDVIPSDFVIYVLVEQIEYIRPAAVDNNVNDEFNFIGTLIGLSSGEALLVRESVDEIANFIGV